MSGTPKPTSEQLRRISDSLRSITRTQATMPLEHTLGGPAIRVIVTGLEELADAQDDPRGTREALLSKRLAAVEQLATSRRLPLAAIEGVIRRAQADGSTVVSIAAVQAALSATEPQG